MAETKKKKARRIKSYPHKHVEVVDTSEMVEPKRVGRGRPSKYRPEFCQVVIDLGREGKTFVQLAAALGISRETLYAWSDQYPEFSDALRLSRDLSEDWWVKAGQEGLYRGGNAAPFQAGLWAFFMKARFGWRDTQDVTVQSKVEVTDPQLKEVQELDEGERKKRIAQLQTLMLKSSDIETDSNE